MCLLLTRHDRMSLCYISWKLYNVGCCLFLVGGHLWQLSVRVCFCRQLSLSPHTASLRYSRVFFLVHFQFDWTTTTKNEIVRWHVFCPKQKNLLSHGVHRVLLHRWLILHAIHSIFQFAVITIIREKKKMSRTIPTRAECEWILGGKLSVWLSFRFYWNSKSIVRPRRADRMFI